MRMGIGNRDNQYAWSVAYPLVCRRGPSSSKNARSNDEKGKEEKVA